MAVAVQKLPTKVAAGLGRESRVQTNAALEVAPSRTLTTIAAELGLSVDDAEKALRDAAEKRAADAAKAVLDAEHAELLKVDGRLLADRADRVKRRDAMLKLGVPLNTANRIAGVRDWGDFETIDSRGTRIAFNGKPLNSVANLAPSTPRVSSGDAAPWQSVKAKVKDRIATVGEFKGQASSKKARFYSMLKPGMTCREAYEAAGGLLPQSTLSAEIGRMVVAGIITLERAV